KPAKLMANHRRGRAYGTKLNVSITEADHLVGYVRKKVKSGGYNNASEVVRDRSGLPSQRRRTSSPACRRCNADRPGVGCVPESNRWNVGIPAIPRGWA